MTKLVGIVNLTPDSFSDGGAIADTASALRAAERMKQEGACVIDIGAESTRPGATALSHAEEWARLEPVLREMETVRAVVSVDTRHAETARKALDHGARWVNDVGGFADAAMVSAVRDADCALVVMHSLSVPADPKVTLPADRDVMLQLLEWAVSRMAELEDAGIARERIILDPGIGFGKTREQSLAILERVQELNVLGVPLLVGHSRKSFLGGAVEDRDSATLDYSAQLLKKRVDYLRVHNVKAHAALIAERKYCG